MVTEIGNYCYRVQGLEIKREPSSPVTKKVSIFPVSLNGVSQAISSLTPQRWIQFNFNVSFPFDLSEEDTSIVSGVPPSRNPWVPWVTAAFITPHTWPPATYSDKWADHLEFLSFFPEQNPKTWEL